MLYTAHFNEIVTIDLKRVK